jgi:hypothetical protein
MLYGCIREINDLFLNISLPNNLKGSVSITEVSDSLNILLEREANEEEMVSGALYIIQSYTL